MSDFLPTAAELDRLSHGDAFRNLYSHPLLPRPFDIPWLDSGHNGYPISSNPSVYVKLRRTLESVPSFRDDAALWIGAMTFGLLEAITLIPVTESMFVANDGTGLDGKRVVSGSRLAMYLGLWDRYMFSYIWPDEDKRLSRGREVAHLLDNAFSALDEEHSWGIIVRAGLSLVEHQDILARVTFLTLAVCVLSAHIWHDMDEFQRFVGMVASSGTGPVTENVHVFWKGLPGFCMRLMHDAGWCPYTIRFELLASIRRVNLWSTMSRLPPFIREVADEHRTCAKFACRFYSGVDTENYEPRHVEPSCKCELKAPPIRDVIRLLCEVEDGRIPVVVFEGDDLQVRPAEPNAYVAISHVWADGLGSVTEVGLPVCQLSRLAKHAQSLLPSSNGAFWMDSLCIPREKIPRRRAIRLMAETYKEAAVVLVLDEVIRRWRPGLNTTADDTLLSIAASGWVRRVWTLQEGLFARRLAFECVGNRALPLEEILPVTSFQDEWILKVPDTERGKSWEQEFYYQHVPLLFSRVSRLVQNQSLFIYSLDELVELMTLRETTKPEDETVAISSLLSLNIDRLLAINGSNAADMRMKDFFLQLGGVTRVLPFNGCPKLHLPGFRWAPRSLTRVDRLGFKGSGNREPVDCTEDGLVGRFYVASLLPPLSGYTGLTYAEDDDCYRTPTDRPMIVALSYAEAQEPSPSYALLNLHLYHLTPDGSYPTIDTLIFNQPDALEQREYVCILACHHRKHIEPTPQVDGEADPLRYEYIGIAVYQRIMGLDMSNLKATQIGTVGEACICLG